MAFWKEILQFLNLDMETPTMFGWFHILFFALSIGIGVLLCILYKEGTEKQARRIVLFTAILVTVLEIYKQINFSFSYSDEAITFSYQWYAFPWQFCSMPMYVGLLAGITRGKVHRCLCAFLATYAVFAGVCVMLYPVDVFTNTIGINIQTMVCHGSMITVGLYLLYTNYVKSDHKTLLQGLLVFAVAVLSATVMNEIAYRTGLTEEHYFNMFYISPHADPHLPVYSTVQELVPYPWCLLIYIAAFALAAYVILLISAVLKRLFRKPEPINEEEKQKETVTV